MAPTTRERVRTTRRLTRLLAAAAIATAAVALLAAPASAHAELQSTDPPAGAQLSEAPAAVTLTFDEPVSAQPSAIRVYDRRGDRLSIGDASAGPGATVTAGLPRLGDGSYVVTWRVVSDDGHPERGAFTFSVGEAQAPVPTGLAERLLSSQGGSTAVGATYALARFLSFGASLVLVGATTFLALRWPEGFDRRAQRWLTVAALVAFAAALAGTVLQPLYADARPFGDVTRSAVWTDILDTRVGRAWAARALLVAAFVPLAVLATGPVRSAWKRFAAPVLGAGVILTFTFAGHATTGRHVLLGVTADLVHLVAVALWSGGLAVVFGATRSTRTGEGAGVVAPRFSTLAVVTMAAIVASGFVQAWRQVGSSDGLRETDYGRLLLFKLFLVVVLVVVASTSRDLVRRHLADDSGDGERVRRRLRRSVAVEVAYAVVILGVTALLVNAAPPREELTRPFAEIVTEEGYSFDLLVTPAQAGRNEVHVTVLTPDGFAAPTQEAHASFRDPGRDIAPLDAPLRQVGTGHYIAGGVDLPFGGDWILDVKVRLGDVDQVSTSVTVRIR